MDELLELIVRESKRNCSIDISLDGLPKKGGVSAEMSPGYKESQYYSKHSVVVIPVLFMAKDRCQQGCLKQLETVCSYFQGLKALPKAEHFSWLDASIATYPNKVGVEEDRQYIYSAIVNMKLYI